MGWGGKVVRGLSDGLEDVVHFINRWKGGGGGGGLRIGGGRVGRRKWGGGARWGGWGGGMRSEGGFFAGVMRGRDAGGDSGKLDRFKFVAAIGGHDNVCCWEKKLKRVRSPCG